MTTAAPAQLASLPLLAWPEAVEVARLERERRALQTRIQGLPVHAHRRVILEHQLIALTLQQLELSNKMRGRL